VCRERLRGIVTVDAAGVAEGDDPDHFVGS
jgi:hypothetical protein